MVPPWSSYAIKWERNFTMRMMRTRDCSSVFSITTEMTLTKTTWRTGTTSSNSWQRRTWTGFWSLTWMMATMTMTWKTSFPSIATFHQICRNKLFLMLTNLMAMNNRLNKHSMMLMRRSTSSYKWTSQKTKRKQLSTRHSLTSWNLSTRILDSLGNQETQKRMTWCKLPDC